VSGRGIISRFVCIVTLTWLSVGVGLDILMLVLDAEREIATGEKIGLFNSTMIGESLCLTNTGINEGRD